ncbi:ComEC/Rec2 family competence protein [Abyssalbus ytuae]|uniref:ComEC family competence protein n=1 Tax=Abyssalbus ytuae TaxID=2926907 RepID=A0A9E6ZQI5_9FLAO|nr:ComEC/Rec2 family competence protein [Abyssalbus ytuae]UOB18720.1 ComEC family competence protein [Abyssalbus ytuae]
MVGILLGHYINFNPKTILIITLAFLSLLLSLYLYLNKKYCQSEIFSIFAFFTTISIGILTQSLHKKDNHLNHYTKFIKENTSYPLTMRIHKKLNSGKLYERFEIEILNIDNKETSGKAILNMRKDSTLHQMNIDEVYYTLTGLNKLNDPLNPDQFNYKNYLKKQHIYHQLYLNPNELKLLSGNITTIYGLAALARSKINNSLEKYSFTKNELSVINALLLGQRQDISEEVYNNYTSAGAIHILAVSGLHVGIILLILSYILKPLDYFKKGNIIKLLLILISLWSFAIIAGLSASVVRAVTMFSLVAYAMHIKRATNIYNILAISMFILLLFKPYFIFDVGFQLSYIAVFAIVWIQPIIYRWWVPKFKAVNFFWEIFTVTIAAQLGIIPISLYYFHQFPGLFFISNLVIIPLLGIILGFGIIIIIMALMNVPSNIIFSFYGKIIDTMNKFVWWIAGQEDFLFKDIPFNINLLIASYVFIISFIFFIKKITRQRIIALLISFILVQVAFIYNKYSIQKTQYFIVFHKNRNTVTGYHNGRELTLSEISFENDKIIKSYAIANQISDINSLENKNVFDLKKRGILLVIDSAGVYNIENIKTDHILLKNSPKINLNRAIDIINPKQIIADGSNYKSYIEKWKVSCNERKIPFHATGEKGAYIIKLE